MARYIDADKAIEKCNLLLDNYASCPDPSALAGVELVRKLILSDCETGVPTADVVEVKHGYSVSKMHYSDEFICSECGLIMRDCCRYVIDEDADGDEACYEFEFRYCPNCGAKMERGRSKE